MSLKAVFSALLMVLIIPSIYAYTMDCSFNEYPFSASFSKTSRMPILCQTDPSVDADYRCFSYIYYNYSILTEGCIMGYYSSLSPLTYASTGLNYSLLAYINHSDSPDMQMIVIDNTLLDSVFNGSSSLSLCLLNASDEYYTILGERDNFSIGSDFEDYCENILGYDDCTCDYFDDSFIVADGYGVDYSINDLTGEGVTIIDGYTDPFYLMFEDCSEKQLMQTNPQFVDLTTLSDVIAGKTQDYFIINNGNNLLNAYATYQDLEAGRNYTLGVVCGGNGAYFRWESLITPDYKDLSFVGRRSEWLTTNSQYLIMAFFISVILIIAVVLIYKSSAG